MFDVVSFTPGSDIANAGTATIAYPTGRSKGSYSLKGKDHVLFVAGNKYTAPADFTLTFNANASSITLTSNIGRTIAAGTACRLQIERRGAGSDGEAPASPLDPNKVQFGVAALIDLGSPNVADADGVCASQSGTAATPMTINGALAASGVATFDVPRNVVAAWTNTATLTVTGTDEYGEVVVETSGSGTSMAGKKAFKTITSVVPSANITSATVGTGDVLGLPVFVAGVAQVFRELQDGAAATAGTVVAGVASKATATTGDVRGTYDPNAACDGDKGFVLGVILTDPKDLGVAQYGG